MWPSFRSRTGRAFNRRQLAAAARRLPEPTGRRIAITTVPVVADMIGVLPVDRWVYYCVDDLAAWPGLDGRSLAQLESLLVARADEIVVVSDHLAARLAGMGRHAEVLTHGVDLEHWRAPAPSPSPLLEGVPRPLFVFWGVIDRRLDVEWLTELERAMTSGTVVLVGPHNEPDPRLRSSGRLLLTGSVPYSDLPAVAAAADVLLMPYIDSAVTRAMQPLKLKEYLATGRPVVVRDLPAVAPWRDACDAVGDAATFVARVLERSTSATPPAQIDARQRLADESWDHKARLFERIVLGTR